MRLVAGVAAMVLCTRFLLGPAAGLAAEPPAEPRDISGRYRSKGDTTKSVTLTAVAGGVYRAVGDGWEGAGTFDGTIYWGVFRVESDQGSELGTHRGDLQPDGSLAIHGEYVGGSGKPFEAVWTPERVGRSRPRSEKPAPRAEPTPRVIVTPPDGDRLPAIGEYVYIDELPEALTKVAPVYSGVEGTVLVQALVGKDGRVADTKIVKSIHSLDEAAVNAVRQWVFKPAMAAGKPVAVWVAVPIRFAQP